MGGRGIIDLRIRHKEQIDILRSYFREKAVTSNLYETIANSDKNLTPLNLSQKQIQAVDNSIENLKHSWKGKELHGRYPNMLEQEHIDKRASVAWMAQGNLFPETEGFICAIQDQVISTRSYLKYIIKDPSVTTTKCRRCGEGNENIEHIISGCKTLAPKEYTNRHNNVAKIIHMELSIKYGCTDNRLPYYKYTPESIVENDACKIYWDRTIQTDRPVQHNRPDICLLDKTENKVTFIEIAVPAPANIHRKHAEKIEKYLELEQDTKEVWRVKDVRTIPIIIGATGEIPKQLLKNLRTLGIAEYTYKEMQKTVILATCNIMRKVLNIPR